MTFIHSEARHRNCPDLLPLCSFPGIEFTLNIVFRSNFYQIYLELRPNSEDGTNDWVLEGTLGSIILLNLLDSMTENRGPRKLRDLPKVTQLDRGETLELETENMGLE